MWEDVFTPAVLTEEECQEYYKNIEKVVYLVLALIILSFLGCCTEVFT